MIFSSFTFLWYFLPLTLFSYYLLPGLRLKNFFLLAASLLFYSWGHFPHLIWLLEIITLTYLVSFGIRGPHSQRFLWLGILFILGGLFYFKYFNFSLSVFQRAVNGDWFIPDIILPIGISFYSFQAISYLVDIYRGGPIQKNFFDLALYISMFPQLVAGPIVKYHTVRRQLLKRRHTLEKVYLGFRRFAMGLGKKIIIADTLGFTVDRVFDAQTNTLSVPIMWVGIIFYTLQIYFDFSGYSDMAIGLGKMFGFEFLENFNYPYISRSVSEFWRRWHISLSSWFKEYIYIPLGGNRQGLKRTCFNLMIVFLLTGIWHGANWTFILWGIWYGIFIVLEKCLKNHLPTGLTDGKNLCLVLLSHGYTLLIVLFGWILFRSPSLAHTFSYVKGLFGGIAFRQQFGIGYYVRSGGWVIMTIGLLLAFGAGRKMICARSPSWRFLSDLLLWGLLLCCIVFLTATGYNPFIYFNF